MLAKASSNARRIARAALHPQLLERRIVRLLLEQGPEDPAVLPVQGEALLEPLAAAPAPSSVRVDRVDEAARQLLEPDHAVLGERHEQMRLVVEVPVERAAPGSCRLEHVLRRWWRGTLGRRRSSRAGIEDALDCLRGLLESLAIAASLAGRRLVTPAPRSGGRRCQRAARPTSLRRRP